MLPPQLRLDPLQQQPEEQIVPALTRPQPPPEAAASPAASSPIPSRSTPTYRRNASATVSRSTRDRSGGHPAAPHHRRQHRRSNSVTSAISPSRPAPGRYHSSMVNSGACVALASPLRHTRAN